ncbi:4-hydroxy-3-methylbut-2-en-1-yl diphosphate synthase [Salinibacter sp. 10B]|uniref:flavodoxin-dependent (E)-4-hydroxy-3-methylbut-2-enyl-diphosphate synthase n=1 Tax=Salinibacter sp. 10B TaxID=1923971 RepID=UPI000CF4C5ED|nr:flavodoxin-dependent (E)-4-hydroxy-3-methylbut-2-enyl-diphosphate synthase [Salinibacter sp. 10B]PQJ36153.1 4-hydroxy-3-methylbut-2-en-1-yl diphosphate synthase [Salinibacter sp. 10B]
MDRPRRETRPVQVGDVQIGGDAPVSVQSMTTTKTHEVDATLDEINRLAEAGADIVRVAVPRPEDADALADIVQGATVPVVADIHFNYQYALKAIEAGIHKVRINPGNIGKPEWEREVLQAAKDAGIPIRIGVNSGSLEEDILEKHGYPKPQALFESAMRHVEVCHKNDFEDIVISVKHSDPMYMIQAYRKVAEETNYPLHLGVTESGTLDTGTVKSSIGIGSLLADGIGDTIRVSLAADPVEEVKVGHRILKSLGIGRPGVNIIACPTCGRLVGDLFSIVEEVEEAVAERSFDKDLNVALMGCAVNGPGEASGADLGISLGRGRAHFFKHGEVVDTVPEDEIVDRILDAIDNWDEEDDAAADDEASVSVSDPSGDGAPTDADEPPSDEGTDATGVTKPDLPTS